MFLCGFSLRFNNRCAYSLVETLTLSLSSIYLGIYFTRLLEYSPFETISQMLFSMVNPN